MLMMTGEMFICFGSCTVSKYKLISCFSTSTLFTNRELLLSVLGRKQ
jgi:hypothetical protein